MFKDGTNTADIVLEGGGVKGIAFVGALEVLSEAGYSFERMAGTSAGALVGAAVAAGIPIGDLVELMRSIDYKRFRDRDLLGRMPGGRLVSLLFEGGIYQGDYLAEFVDEVLGLQDVSTFGDLRLPDEQDSTLPDEHRYRLVVFASDMSQSRLVRLPWDYGSNYGLPADDQKISDAVRASMSLPFFFEPATIDYEFDGKKTKSQLVDGGLLSNFPISLFDRNDGRPPRWPTFGLKLSARPEDKQISGSPDSAIGLSLAMITTLTTFNDAVYTDRPDVRGRTIFIDTLGIDSTNFDITAEEQDALYHSGRHAAERFLDVWDFDGYLARDQVVNPWSRFDPAHIDKIRHPVPELPSEGDATDLDSTIPEENFAFIAYARGESAYVEELAGFLEQNKIPVWYDRHLEVGDRWLRKILQMVESSSAFVVVSSPPAGESRYVEIEILRALDHDKRFFPILLRGDPIDLIADIQAEDVRKPCPGRDQMPSDRFVTKLRATLLMNRRS